MNQQETQGIDTDEFQQSAVGSQSPPSDALLIRACVPSDAVTFQAVIHDW